jgi:hypothetical protein
MIRKVIATTTLTGGLALGLGGVASATTTPNAPAAIGTHTFNCANAPKIEARITKIEAKANTWLPKAQARLTKAQQNHHPKVVTRIQNRITRVNKILTRVQGIEAKLTVACPGAIANPTPSVTS